MINVAVALWLLYRFGDHIHHAATHKMAGILVLVALAIGLFLDNILWVS